MNTFVKSRQRVTMVAVSLAATVALALTGCVSQPGSPASERPSNSSDSDTSGSGSSPAASTNPSPSSSAVAGATPTKIACGTLLSAQAVYDFNPNFGLDSSFTPKSGTAAATAVAERGTACTWRNQTSKETFTIAVARPAATEFASLRSKVATGTATPGLGDAAYFSSSDSSSSGAVGRIDVFTGAYWLVATSVYFGSATDAKDLVTTALRALK
ncbi:arginyl-tRNA synthetase [Frigoribacterium sp. CG_9.8]|uniref:arginyl-tRNA synthetase n=1 Tax=Frigoribacterium sp. CG_9.8 TaxID=2787733 RepID=UPI0018CBE2FB|nr:arginyl-tRNA synthetase [Frigoribacterium sp. CG_9.8]MBG6107637.1 hypothetical protein [Frigoribacterium sp. CG_9.8]